MLVHPTARPRRCCSLQHFQIRYIVVHFGQKSLVVCVPSTTEDCHLFNNHRNKKVVGGNYNVIAYYVDASAPN